MNVKLPDGTVITGVPEGTTQEDLQDAIQRLPVTARPGFAAKAAAERERERAEYDPTKDMSLPEKISANWSAGFGNLVQGARQIAGNLGLGEGVSGEDVEEKRRLDDQLARATPYGKVIQVGAEIVPTLAIPAGGFAATAGRVLPRALAAGANAARLGTAAAVADAALAGGTYGALQPVTDHESRALNAALGAGLGAALPVGAAGLNAARRMVTTAGAGERAAAQVAGELDDPEAVRALVQRLKDAGVEDTAGITTYGAKAADEGTAQAIPLTTAAQLADPTLARLEAGSRAKSGANWYDFDQRQGRAVADAVKDATRSAEDVATLRSQRQANWDRRWSAANEAADPVKFGQRLDDLRDQLASMATGPESSNHAVRSLVENIQGELERLGPDFSPGHLQQLRANLNGRTNPVSPNVYASAPRESAAVRQLMGTMDDILEDSTGGAWKAVREGYAKDSADVAAAKAAGRVRERFYDPDTGRVLGKSLDVTGEVPTITEYGLGGAMNAARAPDKSTVLSQAAQDQLHATLDALRRQAIVQGVKRSATAGGGSNTASDLFAAGAADLAGEALPKAGMTGKALDLARQLVNGKRDAELAAALQDPAKMLGLLKARLASGDPLTPYETSVLSALQAGAKVPEAATH